MRRVSSRLTPLYKWAFPVMWFVILAAMVMVALMVPGADSFQRVMFLGTAVFMAVFGYFVFRKLVFDLVDEVVDEGDSLVVKNRGKSDRIALSDIRNVSYSTLINPSRVTLSLRKPGVFGDEVTFCAPLCLVPFASHPVINKLIERIDVAREARRAG
jgi:hypothetical protein